MTLDLSVPQPIHIVGIGGAGMRAIARVLLDLGHDVQGSDAAPSPFLDELARLGAHVFVGHDGAQLGAATVLTRSTAVPDDNPEVVAALERGVPVLSRADVLAAISATRRSILVAGTHGKTTTSSLLATVLHNADRQPGFVIGADVVHLGNAAWPADGVDAVIEADESDGTFLDLVGAHAVVTSLDPDHLEFYGSREALDAAFVDFVRGVGGTTAVCIDDADVGPLLGLDGVVTYGTDERSDLVIRPGWNLPAGTQFRLAWQGQDLGDFFVGLPGIHNLRNAAGAAAIGLTLGLSSDEIRQGLAAYGGVARRYEHRGSRAGVEFVDDYAHLPAEVETTITTALGRGHRRVIATYQPHRYSRTQALAHTFADSFVGVDHLVLTGIYPSGEAPRDGVTGRLVHDAVTASNPEFDVSYCETLDDVVDQLASILRPGDLCLTLGAGDLTTVPDRIRESLRWPAMLRAESPVEVAFDAPLGSLTTYRAGGHAAAFAEAQSLDELLGLLRAAQSLGVSVLTVGRGSNLLVSDRGFAGLAVRLTDGFDGIEIDGTRARLGAAVPLPTAARRTVAAGLTGFEWAVGVPGTVGGAVRMNAGGHGSDMAASLVEARVANLATGTVERWTSDDLAFGYRSSAIGSDHIVVDAVLELAPGDPASGDAELSEIVRWRREHQPGGQNAGSVFTNPDGDSAGRLIDAAGGKGVREGSAEVSAKHANFIQVDAVDGRADDVFVLMRRLTAMVHDASGVVLEPETHMVGFEGWPSWRAFHAELRGHA